MNRIIIVVFYGVLITFLGVNTAAALINVPGDSSTIQAGINGALNGDTVLVADGHYYERINFNGKHILVASELILDGDSLHIDSTIIDADTSVIGYADTGSVVCFVNGEDSTSVLQGFTIQGGSGTPNYSNHAKSGGGIFCFCGGSPIIKDVIIKDNYATLGSGIYGGLKLIRSEIYDDIYDTLGMHLIIESSILLNNSLSIIDCASIDIINSKMNNCIIGGFAFPHYTLVGDSIYNSDIWLGDEGELEIYNCVLIETDVEIINSFALIDNSLIIGEIFAAGSASPYITARNSTLITDIVFNGSTLLLENCIAYTYGESIIESWSSHITITCSDIFGFNDHWLDCDYCVLDTNNVFFLDPRFCDTTNHDYHLAANSPCTPGNNSCGILIGAYDVNCDSAYRTWYISTSGSDSIGSGTQENPFETIQHGIDVSIDGDTVLAADGHYYERINFNGKHILVASELILDGDSLHIDSTIIDADTSVIGYADTGSVVCFVNDEDSTSVLQGFTIKNGTHGVYVYGSSPVIEDCCITGNTAGDGSGVYATYGASPQLLKCKIIDNTVYSSRGCPIIEGCIVDGVIKGEFSGGGTIINSTVGSIDWQMSCFGSIMNSYVNGYIYLFSGSNIDIFKCEISGTVSAGDISTVFIDSSVFSGVGDAPSDGLVVASNCLVTGESYVCNYGYYVEFYNCTILGQIEICGDSWLTIDSCIVYFDSLKAVKCLDTYSNIYIHCTDIYGYEGSSWLEGIPNVLDTSNVFFLDPRFCDTTNHDYHLAANSPCAPGNNSCGILIGAYDVNCDSAYRTWYISTSGSDSTGSGTQENPFETIQHGIDVSIDGDTVLVADGHYYERINFNGKHILVASEIILDGDSLHIDSTIIDADTSVIGYADTGSVVCFVNEEDSNTVFYGFTIKNGIGTMVSTSYLQYGGGIYCGESSSPTISNNMINGNHAHFGGGICCDSSSSPTISNNTITGNWGNWFGGGIYCFASFPTIINNTITENRVHIGEGGGGICCFSNSNPVIGNNTISENYAELGGGIYCDSSSSPTISNNTISRNWGNWDGGGIDCWGSSSVISNNTITGNQADFGGGICCGHGSSATISNNTISGNSAVRGGGVHCGFSSSPTINNNTISGNYTYYGYGGGIDCWGSSPAISNNTITGNGALRGGGINCDNADPVIISNSIIRNISVEEGYGKGGGICCVSSSPTLRKNTFYGNSSNNGGGMYCGESSTPIIINTIFWADSALDYGNEFVIVGGTPIVSYCDIRDTLWPGEGNISCDPMFCYPDTGNYYLADLSCCVGAGEGGIDIGAFSIGCFIYAYLPGDANMYRGAWPPAVIGSDVTYLVNYFRGLPTSQPCMLDSFWCSADVNGDCNIIGSDATKLINYLRGIGSLSWCPDYEPVWLTPFDLPPSAPTGWPNCEIPVFGSGK